MAGGRAHIVTMHGYLLMLAGKLHGGRSVPVVIGGGGWCGVSSNVGKWGFSIWRKSDDVFLVVDLECLSQSSIFLQSFYIFLRWRGGVKVTPAISSPKWLSCVTTVEHQVPTSCPSFNLRSYFDRNCSATCPSHLGTIRSSPPQHSGRGR